MIIRKEEFEDYLSYCASQGIEPVTEEEIGKDQNEDEKQEELITDRVQAKEYKIERRK